MIKKKTLDKLLEGLEGMGIRVERINPKHVAMIYKGEQYLGTIIDKRGTHEIKWGEKTPILNYHKIIKFIIDSGYPINF